MENKCIYRYGIQLDKKDLKQLHKLITEVLWALFWLMQLIILKAFRIYKTG